MDADSSTRFLHSDLGLPTIQLLAGEVVQAARLTEPRPVTEPDQPSLVVCYASADEDYARRLVVHLSQMGLPAWSMGHLAWGDDYTWKIRQKLRYALAVIVLMSPEAQDSDDVTREILEGQRHSRTFFPILLRGERMFLLASTGYFDARDGALPGPAELRLLRQLHETHLGVQARGPLPVLPEQLAHTSAVRGMHAPAVASPDGLRSLLAETEIEDADLVTTPLLLQATGRLESGWMRQGDASQLSDALLTGIDAAWSEFSGGRYGFRAQLELARAKGDRHPDFLALSLTYGWRGGTHDVVPWYGEFIGRAQRGPGFFPTLRNPQNEQYPDWYDRWTTTVLAVHQRLREWEGSR